MRQISFISIIALTAVSVVALILKFPHLFILREISVVHESIPIFLLITTGLLIFILRKNLSTCLIFLISLWVSAGYISVTSINDRQHDVSGHVEYLQKLINDHHLPKTQETWQSYQPPLYYWMLQGWVKVNSFISNKKFENQTDSFFLLQAFSWILFALSLTLGAIVWKQVNNKNPLHPFAALFFTAIPAHLFFAARVNNDVPIVILSILSIIQFSKYAKKQSISAALSMGIIGAACILVKLTGLATYGALVLGVLWIEYKKRIPEPKELFRWLIVALPGIIAFAGILIRSHKDTGAWLYTNVNNLNSALAVKNNAYRFLSFDLKALLQQLNADPWGAEIRNSIPTYAFVTWLQGEFGYGENYLLLLTLFRVFVLILFICSIIGLRKLLYLEESIEIKFSFLLTAMTIGFFICLNLTQSFSCTTDARYIAGAFLPIALIMGRGLFQIKILTNHLSRIMLYFGTTGSLICFVIFYRMILFK